MSLPGYTLAFQDHSSNLKSKNDFLNHQFLIKHKTNNGVLTRLQGSHKADYQKMPYMKEPAVVLKLIRESLL